MIFTTRGMDRSSTSAARSAATSPPPTEADVRRLDERARQNTGEHTTPVVLGVAIHRSAIAYVSGMHTVNLSGSAFEPVRTTAASVVPSGKSA